MAVAAVAVADSVVGAVEDLVRDEPVGAEHASAPRRRLPLLRRLRVPRRLVPVAPLRARVNFVSSCVEYSVVYISESGSA